jgi:cobalt-zinc-cadmium efflux system outer membrane protein
MRSGGKKPHRRQHLIVHPYAVAVIRKLGDVNRRWLSGGPRTTMQGEQGMRIATLLTTLAIALGIPMSAQASPLSAAFEGATERTPEIPALVARRAEIDARARSTEALLPGGPWVTVMHRTDALTHDRGTREYEAEYGVPIWLRGERGATLAAALTEGERIEAEIRARRLEVSKRVREAYWMVAEAREQVGVAERRRATAATLAKSQRERSQTGQAELIESKLADADARDAEVSLAGVRAELNQATIAFRVLTGQDPPVGFSEDDAGGATPADHPRVVLRKVAIQKALADERLIWTVDRERPELGAFVNNNRDTNAEPVVTSLGVRLKIPFSYDAVNEPKRAAAAADVVAAQEELALAEREVGGEAAQARARLEGARQQLKALDARRSDLAAAEQLTQEAQRAGQVMFNDLIRARLQLYEADLARVRARVAVERARSDYNQALGLEP